MPGAWHHSEKLREVLSEGQGLLSLIFVNDDADVQSEWCLFIEYTKASANWSVGLTSSARVAKTLFVFEDRDLELFHKIVDEPNTPALALAIESIDRLTQGKARSIPCTVTTVWFAAISKWIESCRK